MKRVLWAFLLLFILQIGTASTSESADYVVVGLGTSGSVLVNKLTKDKKNSVIALHQGKKFSYEKLVRYFKNELLIGSTPLLTQFESVWLLLSEEWRQQLTSWINLNKVLHSRFYETGETTIQEYASHRKFMWEYPSMAGGISSVNGGIWCRGSNEAYAEWGCIAGTKWSLGRLQSMFKWLERFGGDTHSRFRGSRGALNILQMPSTKIGEVFSEAIVNATGFACLLDYNDSFTPIGIFNRIQLTRKKGNADSRESSINAFLNETAISESPQGSDARQLQIHYQAEPTHIIWKGNKAVGVAYYDQGRKNEVFAKKGVILCSGIKNVGLLMRSGIGPRDLLNQNQIPVIYDLPTVGQGLVDHPRLPLFFASDPHDSVTTQETIYSQIACLPIPFENQQSRQIKWTTLDIVPGMTLVHLDLCQPKSRGNVTFETLDLLASPHIDVGLFSDERDLDLYVLALKKYVRDIHQMLQASNPAYQLVFPNPTILNDDNLLREFVKNHVYPSQHFQSYCRMAPLEQGGVVDNFGRVYGVRNLYIADNSIVPYCTDGEAMTTEYLIGANIARLIGYLF